MAAPAVPARASARAAAGALGLDVGDRAEHRRSSVGRADPRVAAEAVAAARASVAALAFRADEGDAGCRQVSLGRDLRPGPLSDSAKAIGGVAAEAVGGDFGVGAEVDDGAARDIQGGASGEAVAAGADAVSARGVRIDQDRIGGQRPGHGQLGLRRESVAGPTARAIPAGRGRADEDRARLERPVDLEVAGAPARAAAGPAAVAAVAALRLPGGLDPAVGDQRSVDDDGRASADGIAARAAVAAQCEGGHQEVVGEVRGSAERRAVRSALRGSPQAVDGNAIAAVAANAIRGLVVGRGLDRTGGADREPVGSTLSVAAASACTCRAGAAVPAEAAHIDGHCPRGEKSVGDVQRDVAAQRVPTVASGEPVAADPA